MKIIAPSPGKINWFLKIENKRADGYHNIYSLVSKISFYDLIYINLEKSSSNRINIRTLNYDIPNEENIATKLLRSLFNFNSHYKADIEVIIDKRIPPGSGLGGGSSNAGILAKIIHKNLKFKISDEDFYKQCTDQGADIGFFVKNCRSAIMEGKGEKITPVNFYYGDLYLVIPPINVNTKHAYALFDKNYKEGQKDLEPYVLRHYKALADIREMLYSLGAEGVTMSGSGSSFFVTSCPVDLASRFGSLGCLVYKTKTL